MRKKKVYNMLSMTQKNYKIPLCEGDHDYGHLDFITGNFAGKVCKKCTHIIWKEQIKAPARKIITTVQLPHLDLFHF